MYNFKKKDEQCVFCLFAQGIETEHKKMSDIVLEDDKTIAFIAPKWWVNNPGQVIIIPKKHFETIYEIPDDLLAHVHIIAKKVTIALKETYKCDGTSIRQHNEPAGNQAVPHLHVNVFPRYENDELYQRHNEKRFVSAEERKPYAEKLKAYFRTM